MVLALAAVMIEESQNGKQGRNEERRRRNARTTNQKKTFEIGRVQTLMGWRVQTLMEESSGRPDLDDVGMMVGGVKCPMAAVTDVSDRKSVV